MTDTPQKTAIVLHGRIVSGHVDEPTTTLGVLGSSEERADLLAALQKNAEENGTSFRAFHALAWSRGDAAAVGKRYTIWAEDLSAARELLTAEVGDSITSLWDVRRSEEPRGTTPNHS